MAYDSKLPGPDEAQVSAPMSHFSKTVMNIGYHYHKVSTNRHMDEESKYFGN